MKLYELPEAYRNIESLIDESPEDSEHLQDALNTIEEEFENKLENVGFVIKNKQAEVKALNDEITRLNDRKKAAEKSVTNLKEYMKSQMLLMNKRKVKTPVFSFWIQNNPPSLQVTDESNIPKRFYIEQQPKLNKKDLLKHLQSTNEEVEGVEVTQTEGMRMR